MIRVDTLVLQSGENNIETSESDGDSMYVVTNDSPGTVVQIRKRDMYRMNYLQLNTGENYVDASISDAQNLYLGTHTTPGAVIKVRKSDMAHIGKMEIPSGMKSLTMQMDDLYIYICTFTSPGQILKIQKSTMTAVGVSHAVTAQIRSLNPGENWLLTSQADEYYLYVCTSDTPGVIVKVRKYDLQLSGQLQLQQGENLIQTSQQDDLYLYVGTNDYPGKVVKILKKDMSRVQGISLNAGENLVQTSQLDDTHLYLGTNSYNSPAVLVKLVKSDLSRVGSLTLEAEEVKPFTSESDAKFIYLGLRTSPGRIVKISKTSIIHCEVNLWSEWTDCTQTCAGGMQSHNRTISISPSEGGVACPALYETQVCNEFNCPIPCVVGAWRTWSECDSTTGEMTRTRIITQAPQYNGALCPPLAKQRACAVDCKLSGWSGWSACSQHRGKMVRSRSPIFATQNGGLKCGLVVDEIGCDVNCAVSEWSPWSPCDKKRGVQQRSRKVTLMNKNNGNHCPVLTDYTDCQVHCEAGPWTHYGDCSSEGFALRTRPVVLSAMNEGRPCTTSEIARCAESCELTEWGPWTSCDPMTGRRSRTRAITAQPRNGGRPCPSVEESEACIVDCVVSAWSAWLECNPQTSLQYRTRTKEYEPRNGGQPCPSLIESRHCVLDCTVSEWSSFEDCSKVCGGGKQSRYRVVEIEPSGGGLECPNLQEEQDCNTAMCGENDCQVSEWSSWGDCTKTCGGGEKSRLRTVTRAKKLDGKVCPNLDESQPCNTLLCVIDCSLSNWAGWSTCDPLTGTQDNRRSVLVQPLNGGAKCPPLTETQDCAVDCAVDEYSDWSACDAAIGMQTRTRAVTVPARNGGAICPDLSEFKECGNAECSKVTTQWTEFTACAEVGIKAGTRQRSRHWMPDVAITVELQKCILEMEVECSVNCKVSEWSEWGECEKETGKKATTRVVTVLPRHGGAPCPELREDKDCVINCEVSDFSEFDECNKHNGLKTRVRNVVVNPKNGGNECPSLEQHAKCAVDCELSEWSDWSACDTTTGVVTRKRDVVIGTQNGGKLCENLEEFNDCDEDLQCKSGQWSLWSECYETGDIFIEKAICYTLIRSYTIHSHITPCIHCTGDIRGFKQRTREKIGDFDAGGHDLNEGRMVDGVWNEGDGFSKPCRLEENVKCAVSCQVSLWSQWGSCDQVEDKKIRTRDVIIHPIHGGAVCPELEEPTTCIIHCKVGQWAEWTDCDKTHGRRERARDMLVVPQNGGTACPELDEREVCKVDCELSPWTEWGVCDESTGVKFKERTVIYAGRNGGAPCGILTEYDDCTVHCIASEWAEYTPCVLQGPKAGTMERTRSILVTSKNSGDPCTLDEEVRCAVDCKVTAWTNWQACNKRNNQMKRKRTIIYNNVNGGAACPKQQEYKSCTQNAPTPAPMTGIIDMSGAEASIPHAGYKYTVSLKLKFDDIDATIFDAAAQTAVIESIVAFNGVPKTSIAAAVVTSESGDRKKMLDITVQRSDIVSAMQFWQSWIQTKSDSENFVRRLERTMNDLGKESLLENAVVTVDGDVNVRLTRQETAKSAQAIAYSSTNAQYTRKLDVSMSVDGYTLESFQNQVQYVFLVQLASELGVEPTSIFLKTMQSKKTNSVDFEIEARVTDQEVRATFTVHGYYVYCRLQTVL
jgi:hypothetical protein